MGLHQHGYSPAALDQMVTVNAQVKSGAVAVKVLKKVTPISISVSHLMQLTETIGKELAQARDHQAARHVAGELEPEVKEPPQVAAVATDGGRIFTRAEGAGRGVHEGAWKETKVACLTTFSSEPSDVDPHPELPRCFTDREGVDTLVRAVKSVRNEARDPATTSDDLDAPGGEGESLLESLVLPAETTDNARSDVQPSVPKTTRGRRRRRRKNQKDWRPRRRVRTCVSSLSGSDEFGPKVAAEASRRRFFEAQRRAFLGDGLAWNWTLQARWFPDFVPILDFVHPMTYVYEAARVVAEDENGAWRLCRRWLEACWQGRVSLVLDELHAWQALHPSPVTEKLPDNDGRAIVSKAATYLSNNASRMDYPQYRRMGLPVTSSMVESLIKELNYRVKGSEKAWDRSGGGEWILQVRSAVLCDDTDRLSDFIMSRPGCAYYRPSTTKRASEQNAIAA